MLIFEFCSERCEIGGAGSESAELELGVALHDLDRLPADRPSGAQQRDSLHAHSVPYEKPITTKNAATAAKRSESIRSSMPPWPPSS